MSFPIRHVVTTACALAAVSSVALAVAPPPPRGMRSTAPATAVTQVFTAMTTLPDPAGGNTDFFASSVSLSADGNTALIGAPGDSTDGANAGRAYVFKRSGGIWSKTPVATLSEPTPTANDEFGFSVSLSADASTALVGSCCTAVAGHGGAGTVYVFIQSGSNWSSKPTATLTEPGATGNDHFGVSVALAGSTALVGSPDTAGSKGAAYVFNATGGVWSNTPAAAFSGPAAQASFGTSVALSPDGATVLVGAPRTNSSAGAAFVYTLSAGTWSTTPAASITDPGPGADGFGSSVAVSGSTALVGAPATAIGSGMGAGEAYLYTRTSGTWPATPGTSITEPSAAAGHEFGTSVALSGDESTAIIGARFNNGGVNSKSYLYSQSAGTWNTTPLTAFSEPDPQADANFTSSLALSADGSEGLIGSPDIAYAVAASSSDLLALTLASTPANVTVGQSITYSLTVTNNSTAPATNIILTDALPAGVTFASAAAAGGACNANGATVTCKLAALAAEASWQPTITVNTTVADTPTDVASISADQADPFQADNNASVTNTISAATPPSPGGGKSGGGIFAWPALLALSILAALFRKRRT